MIKVNDSQWQKVLDCLAEGDTVKRACKRARFSPSVFYSRQKSDPEFSERVARAREAFAANVSDEVTLKADERLLELLINGEKRTRKTVKVLKDGEGNVERIVEETHTETYITPKWVYDKLMPDSLAEKILGAGGSVHLHRHEKDE